MSIFKIPQSPCPPGVLWTHFLWLKWCALTLRRWAVPRQSSRLWLDCPEFWLVNTEFPMNLVFGGKERAFIGSISVRWCPWSLQRVVVVMDDGGKQAWFLLNRALFTESHCWELVPTSYKYPLTILNCERTPVLLCARHSPGAFLHSN